jgi:hypothetical protein
MVLQFGGQSSRLDGKPWQFGALWGSAITLRKDGNIILTDYDGSVVWQTEGILPNVQYAQLLDTGNLVLKNSSGDVVWRSFDSPTDTFLTT